MPWAELDWETMNYPKPTKADELLRELFDARVAWINAVPGSEGRLTYAFATAGAYLNEKPQEPPPFKECLGCSSPRRCEALQHCSIKDAGSAEGRASSVGGNEAGVPYAEEPTGSKVSASRVSSLDPASSPHAAAEPVGQPVAWLRYTHTKDWPTNLETCDESMTGAFPVYASPAAQQPIAPPREPTARMLAAAAETGFDPVCFTDSMCEIWRAMYDAAVNLKSAEGET